VILLRPGTPDDVPRVAAIWSAGWRDGHLGGVPGELVAARTPGYFQKRAAERVGDTTVAIVDGLVAGFIMVHVMRSSRSTSPRSTAAAVSHTRS
jgi:hypothetical protein